MRMDSLSRALIVLIKLMTVAANCVKLSFSVVNNYQSHKTESKAKYSIAVLKAKAKYKYKYSNLKANDKAKHPILKGEHSISMLEHKHCKAKHKS